MRRLGPACENIAIAGSLRRLKLAPNATVKDGPVIFGEWPEGAAAPTPSSPAALQLLQRSLDWDEESTVGDIELVLQPRLTRIERPAGDIFDTGRVEYDDQPLELLALIDELIATGLIEYDTAVPRNGARHKRFRSIALDMPVEINITDGRNFGNMMAIRTGDQRFSHALVTPKRKGGLMPDVLVQMGGYLWWYPTYGAASAARERKSSGEGKRLECPTEKEFFRALNLRHLPPDERDATGVQRLGGRLYMQRKDSIPALEVPHQ